MKQVFPDVYPAVAADTDHLSKHFESDIASYDRLTQQSKRIGDTLRVFVDEKLMGQHAVDVARLQSFVDIVRDESAPSELRYDLSNRVMDYLTDQGSPVSARDIDYMFALWSDLPKIDEAAGNYQVRLAEYDTEESRAVLDKLDGTLAITEEDWHNIRVGVDVPKIIELSQRVNVETILARSALLLDRVATATTFDNEVLKDIIELETFYAPLLYLLGLPAWEAILKHHTERARAMATSRDDMRELYDEASAYIGEVRESGLINDVLTDVVGVDLEENDFNFIIDNEETPYGSKSYFSAIRFQNENGIPTRFISRVKSPGSYAHKVIHNYGGEKPQDVFAGTVIVSSIEEMTSVFKGIYENIQQLDSCELVTAPSKTSPVHIKGKSAYIEAVKQGLGEEFEGNIDTKEVSEAVEEPFQVLKVTFTIHTEGISMPVEIQFQTRKDREKARLGGASHLCLKDKYGSGLPGNVPGASTDLKAVNDRKWAMLEGGQNIYYGADRFAQEALMLDARALQELFMRTSELSLFEQVA